uniref:ABC transporter, ATP-binding protein n=1 Tax=Steinernema glaseri TaxID=37863 RepID=A0A1I8A3V4_9BILA
MCQKPIPISGSCFERRNRCPQKSHKDPKPVDFVSLFRYGSHASTVLIVLGVLLAISSGIGISITAFYTGQIVTLLIQGHPTSLEFWKESYYVLHSYIALCTLTVVCSLLQTFLLNIASIRIGQKVKEVYLRSVLSQDAIWFEQQSCPEVKSAFNSIQQIEDAVGHRTANIFRCLACFVSSLMIAYYRCWKLSAPLTLVAPLLAILTMEIIKRRRCASSQETNTVQGASAVAGEAISSSQVVLAFNAQQHEVKRYRTELEVGLRYGLFDSAYAAVLSGTTVLLTFLTAGFCVLYGTILYQSQEIAQPGDIFTIIVCIVTGAVQLRTACEHRPALFNARIAAASVYEIMNTVSPICSTSPAGIIIPKVHGSIEFENVTFRYPLQKSKNALNKITLSINAGERVALVGPCGSGKSTVAALVSRLFDPISGRVLIDGHDIRDLNLRHLRADIVASVQQEPILFNDTISFNLRQTNENISMEQMVTACKMANIFDFIQVLPEGFQTIVGDAEGSLHLSRAQKQRIAIARTLLRKPKILVLDEATTALDGQGENLVRSALFNAIEGRTTIAIAHRITNIRHFDKIVVMENGQIVEVGTHNDLIKLQGLYYSMVESQKLAAVNVHGARVATFIEPVPTELPSTIHEGLDDNSGVSKPQKKRISNSGAVVRNVAKKYLPIYGVGLIFCSMHGFSIPVYASLIGSAFSALGSYDDNLYDETISVLETFVIVGVLAGVSSFIYSILYEYVAEKIKLRLRVGLLHFILHRDGTYFDSHVAEKLIKTLTSATEELKNAYGLHLGEAIFAVASFVTAIVFSLRISQRLAAICIFIFLCQIIIQLVTAETAMDNVRTVQLLTLEEDILKRYSERLDIAVKVNLKTIPLRALNYASNNGLQQLIQACSYLIGFTLLSTNHQTNLTRDPLNIFKVVQTLFFGCAPMAYIISYVPEVAKSNAATAKMLSYINGNIVPTKEEIESNSEIHGPIVFSGVHFAYPSRPDQYVLRNLNLTVINGTSTALVGPPKAGKTAIIALLQRYYPLSSGEIEIAGRKIETMDAKKLRDRLGYVSRSSQFFHGTIAENISYGMDNELSLEHVKAAAHLANADIFIDNLPNRYDTIIGNDGMALSESQKMRLSIARAVLKNPPILLIDCESSEETSRCKLVEHGLELSMKNRTCILIARDLETTTKCEYVAFLENGKVREYGQHDRLMEMNGRYSNFVKQQWLSKKRHSGE